MKGSLITYRNPQGRRVYTHEQYEAYIGIQKENKVGKGTIRDVSQVIIIKIIQQIRFPFFA